VSLFWLAYRRREKSRLAGVVLIDSSDLLHARLHADMAGLGVGCVFAEGHALDEAWRRYVPAEIIGRMLTPEEARQLLERIERADPTPKRPAAPSVRRPCREGQPPGRLMPRDGSITPADLVGKLAVLRVECTRCERRGQYRGVDGDRADRRGRSRNSFADSPIASAGSNGSARPRQRAVGGMNCATP
jgi:hypothetical protein